MAAHSCRISETSSGYEEVELGSSLLSQTLLVTEYGRKSHDFCSK